MSSDYHDVPHCLHRALQHQASAAPTHFSRASEGSPDHQEQALSDYAGTRSVTLRLQPAPGRPGAAAQAPAETEKEDDQSGYSVQSHKSEHNGVQQKLQRVHAFVKTGLVSNLMGCAPLGDT